ncbi:MAG: hypothetical protein N2202_05645 [Proteobacteria bacterium]|nr:hypothetical protein [Pseudomonadota bacterium]
MQRFLFLILLISSLFLGNSLVMGTESSIKVLEKEGIGKYLADSSGKTLYWFKKDSPGKSACMGPCIERWPIFYVENISVPKGINKEDFGTITREDGKKQTTFRGYPLYYWINDKQAGDTTGHGVNNVWFVINPDTFPPK